MPTGRPAKFSEFEQRAIRMAKDHGWTIRDIAREFDKPPTVIHRFLARPMPENPEDCEIVTPIQLTPKSPPTPIRDGDAAYCVVSHLTGIEGHPKLQRPRLKIKPKKQAAKFKPKGAKSA